MTDESHKAVYEAIRSLFEEVAGRFSCARLEMAPGPTGIAVLPKLLCSKPSTATITTMPGADQIDLYLGESTWLELTSRHRPLTERVDEVRSIVGAVTAGRFQEIVWETGGRVTRSRALLKLGDGKTIGRAGWYLRLPIPGRKRLIRYLPYE